MSSGSSLLSVLLGKAKEQIKPYYYQYQSYSANKEHKQRQATVPESRVSKKEDAPSHILVIVIDALRPDFIPDLPMDFVHAIAPAPWTFPSVTSLHTGLRPSDHGSVAHTGTEEDEFAIPPQTDSYPYFPLDFEAMGYDTYTGCGFPVPFNAIRGWYQTHRCYPDTSAYYVIDDYRSWRSKRERTAAYLHLGDLHAPVDAPDEYLQRYDVDLSLPDLRHIRQYTTDFDGNDPECQRYRKEKVKLHEAALEYVSDQLRELLGEVRDNTVTIVTGDHGEGLWEYQDKDRQITDSRPNYCFGHGGTPFDVMARVPMACSVPSKGPLIPDGGWTSLRDIPATLLDIVSRDRTCDGYSWCGTVPEDRPAICEAARYGVERKGVYRGKYKLIQSRADDITLTAQIENGHEKFVELEEPLVSSLREDLPDSWDTTGNTGSVSNFTEEQLQALGYK